MVKINSTAEIKRFHLIPPFIPYWYSARISFSLVCFLSPFSVFYFWILLVTPSANLWILLAQYQQNSYSTFDNLSTICPNYYNPNHREIHWFKITIREKSIPKFKKNQNNYVISIILRIWSDLKQYKFVKHNFSKDGLCKMDVWCLCISNWDYERNKMDRSLFFFFERMDRSLC